MKLTDLLEQMHLQTFHRHIGCNELREDVCVLVGAQSAVTEQHIRILPVRLLAEHLPTAAMTRSCLFCVGKPDEKMPILPEECSVVCFRCDETELCVATQRAIYALLRKAGAFVGRESLLGRLLEGKIQGDQNVAEITQGLGLKQNHRFCMLLVSFFGRINEVPWGEASKQLSRILGNCVVTEYREELIALCPTEEEENMPRFPQEQLEQFLAKQGAYAALSNSAMRPAAIRALYHQTRSVMRFGVRLRQAEDSRIFPYEKYAFYHIVELCADAYRSNLQIQNLVYLCHPALGRVMRFDRDHGTNYMEVLRKYLQNNCNLSQTARELFMHRNTMLNKLEIVRELLEVSLDDSSVREQLQFSFHVLDYAEKILQGRTF